MKSVDSEGFDGTLLKTKNLFTPIVLSWQQNFQLYISPEFGRTDESIDGKCITNYFDK